VTPSEHKDSLHKDWIKSIAAKNSLNFAVTASFDGSLRVFDKQKKYFLFLFFFFLFFFHFFYVVILRFAVLLVRWRMGEKFGM
jgi:hypothetical protein